MHYLIKDIDFEKILNFLSEIKQIHKKNVKKLRNFIEAEFFICRSGCQWRLLPYYYGDWRAIHKRFKAWSDKDIWQKIFERSQVDPDLELVMIDSTVVRAHACSAGSSHNALHSESIGRSKGGFTTKIHALVDALGNPMKFTLTAGQRNDIIQAIPLCQSIDSIPVLADKAYDSNELIDFLIKKLCYPVIPSKKNRVKKRSIDKEIYKERHLIECFFGKLKHFRRVFSRFDKTDNVFLSFIYFISMFI